MDGRAGEAPEVVIGWPGGAPNEMIGRPAEAPNEMIGPPGGAPNEMIGRPAEAPGKVIAPLATAQQGAVRRPQLLANGVSRHVIARRARNGDLHRVHRGVYLAGHEAQAPWAAEHAALLACGERAVLSHASAAFAWSMIDQAPDCVEVTVVGGRRRPRPGIRVHHVSEMDAEDSARVQGMPVTAPARTVIDYASGASDQELERAVAEARIRGLLRTGAVTQGLERARRRPGVARVRALLQSEREPTLTRSEAERRLRRVIVAARLPVPQFNVRIAGYEVDAIWPAHRLIVEVDGFRFHGHRAAFERDRAKDAALVVAGYRVVRITWRQLTDAPLAVVANIARSLTPAA